MCLKGRDKKNMYYLFPCVCVSVWVALPVRAQEENMLCSWRELLYLCTTCSIGA